MNFSSERRDETSYRAIEFFSFRVVNTLTMVCCQPTPARSSRCAERGAGRRKPIRTTKRNASWTLKAPFRVREKIARWISMIPDDLTQLFRNLLTRIALNLTGPRRHWGNTARRTCKRDNSDRPTSLALSTNLRQGAASGLRFANCN